MRDAQATRPTEKKLLVRVRSHRDYLLGILEQLQAHQDDESAHLTDALQIVLDATWGPKI